MLAYIVRKLLLNIPIVLGIVVITFLLFGVVARDPARAYAGKQKSDQQLAAIRHQMGLDKPKWINPAAAARTWRPPEPVPAAPNTPMASTPRRFGKAVYAFLDTQFFDVLFFRFPQSMRYQESVWALMARKGPVSLAVQLPIFIIELGIQLAIALYAASRRGKAVDYLVTVISVLGMSVPVLSLYLGVQWLFGDKLHLFPVAGWNQGFFYALHFAALPIIASVIAGVGGGARFYRTVVLEEINTDYVRTARAKGVRGSEILLTHVFRNVLIPVVTNTVIVLPFLLTGALILESLFQIPGMGGLLVEAIHTQDRPVVMSFVYMTALAYCLMLVVTDIAYAVVDPRVRLQ
ncbi:MAG: transporter, permease protein [Phycisphaerales bacterium]|nr:transporter, permease protein [Phycisphaerales bacterium]